MASGERQSRSLSPQKWRQTYFMTSRGLVERKEAGYTKDDDEIDKVKA